MSTLPHGEGAGLPIGWARSTTGPRLEYRGTRTVGRLELPCISHKVLEDVQLGTWQGVGCQPHAIT